VVPKSFLSSFWQDDQQPRRLFGAMGKTQRPQRKAAIVPDLERPRSPFTCCDTLLVQMSALEAELKAEREKADRCAAAAFAALRLRAVTAVDVESFFASGRADHLLADVREAARCATLLAVPLTQAELQQTARLILSLSGKEQGGSNQANRSMLPHSCTLIFFPLFYCTCADDALALLLRETQVPSNLKLKLKLRTCTYPSVSNFRQ